MVDDKDENLNEEELEDDESLDKEEPEESEEELEEFSIGDTKLARGKAVETWGAKNLEDSISRDDSERRFDSVNFGFEEVGQMVPEDFSYESSERSSGELYVSEDGSVSDLYGTTKRGDSVSMYNTGGGVADESSLYNSVKTGKKDILGSSYRIDSPKKRKAVRRAPKSNLETGVKTKGRGRGASLY